MKLLSIIGQAFLVVIHIAVDIVCIKLTVSGQFTTGLTIGLIINTTFICGAGIVFMLFIGAMED